MNDWIEGTLAISLSILITAWVLVAIKKYERTVDGLPQMMLMLARDVLMWVFYDPKKTCAIDHRIVASEVDYYGKPHSKDEFNHVLHCKHNKRIFSSEQAREFAKPSRIEAKAYVDPNSGVLMVRPEGQREWVRVGVVDYDKPVIGRQQPGWGPKAEVGKRPQPMPPVPDRIPGNRPRSLVFKTIGKKKKKKLYATGDRGPM